MEQERPKCALCKADISDPISDFLCTGCGEYICEDHPSGQPFGPHDVKDHDMEVN